MENKQSRAAWSGCWGEKPQVSQLIFSVAGRLSEDPGYGWDGGCPCPSPGEGLGEQDFPPSMLHWWRVILKTEYERIYTDRGVVVAFSTARRHKENCLIFPWCAAKTPFHKTSSYSLLNKLSSTGCVRDTVVHGKINAICKVFGETHFNT